MFTSNSITITNISLASALLTVGAKLGEAPINVKTVKGDSLTFFFLDNKELRDYLKIWNDDEYRESKGKEGEPFAFIAEAYKTRDQILDSIKQFKKVAVLEKNGKTAIISDGCSEEVKNNILAKL